MTPTGNIPPAQAAPAGGDIARAIKQKALELGFFRAGIAAPRPLPDGKHLDEWIKRGFHAGMTWFARSRLRRRNPKIFEPRAKSVICLARRYDPPETAGAGGLHGVVAAYARGRDYHDLITEKLKEFRAWLKSACGVSFARPCVDSAAVMEKPLARAAGIGWIGKNSILVSEEGSWFNLAEVFTDLELPPDYPAADGCGDCDACVRACPTGAIKANRVVDARICVSYLTVEHRGTFPPELRDKIGGRVFGCDDCQAVCPKNNRVNTVVRENKLAFPTDELYKIVRMSELQFKDAFAGSAMLRAGRAGMARNACIALGNAGVPEVMPALKDAMNDTEPLVREHAGWAVAKLGAKGVV